MKLKSLGSSCAKMVNSKPVQRKKILLVLALTLVTGIICGIFSLCVIRRAEKTNESEETK